MTFQKTKYRDDKILLKIVNDNREIYEPLTRKIGGVWSFTLNGWLFDMVHESSVNNFITTQVETEIEEKNEENGDYTHYAREPSCFGNTPNTVSSESSDSELYNIVQELIDRVSDLEKITQDLNNKLKKIK